MPTVTFFPGHKLLLEKINILVDADKAKEIQAHVNHDLSRLRNFGFLACRDVFAANYANDPLVMELLKEYEALRSKADAITSHANTWTSHFQ